jgi:queuosine precursor transporter
MEILINAMNAWPPECIWLVLLLGCFGAILFLNRFFGPPGLYVYIAIAIIGANIQVLKAVKFSVYPEPVALGTILFSSSYLATDILAERFGKDAAKKGVWLGFIAFLSFVAIMILTLGFSPLTPEQAGEEMAWALAYHDHMKALFTPQLAFFAAGMIAYLTSQFHDVWLFHSLKAKFGGRFLWFRNNASTMVSALIDNTVFSVFAWIVLASNPLPFKTVLVTYILGTYWLRLLVAALDTPVLYLAKSWGYKGREYDEMILETAAS